MIKIKFHLILTLENQIHLKIFLEFIDSFLLHCLIVKQIIRFYLSVQLCQPRILNFIKILHNFRISFFDY